jgi:hypothetical protein
LKLLDFVREDICIYKQQKRLYDFTCAVGRVSQLKRRIKPGAAPIERSLMSFLFVAAMVCVILPLLAGPALRIFVPAMARR